MARILLSICCCTSQCNTDWWGVWKIQRRCKRSRIHIGPCWDLYSICAGEQDKISKQSIHVYFEQYCLLHHIDWHVSSKCNICVSILKHIKRLVNIYNITGPEPAKISVTKFQTRCEDQCYTSSFLTSNKSLNCNFQILAILPKCTAHIKG